MSSQAEHSQHGGSEETDPESSLQLQQAQGKDQRLCTTASHVTGSKESFCVWGQYHILLQGLWYELFGGDPNDLPTEMDNRREEVLSQPLLGEESLILRHSSSYHSLGSDDSPAHAAVHLPLFLPGRVLHITEEGPSRRCVSGGSDAP